MSGTQERPDDTEGHGFTCLYRTAWAEAGSRVSPSRR